MKEFVCKTLRRCKRIFVFQKRRIVMNLNRILEIKDRRRKIVPVLRFNATGDSSFSLFLLYRSQKIEISWIFNVSFWTLIKAKTPSSIFQQRNVGHGARGSGQQPSASPSLLPGMNIHPLLLDGHVLPCLSQLFLL